MIISGSENGITLQHIPITYISYLEIEMWHDIHISLFLFYNRHRAQFSGVLLVLVAIRPKTTTTTPSILKNHSNDKNRIEQVIFANLSNFLDKEKTTNIHSVESKGKKINNRLPFLLMKTFHFDLNNNRHLISKLRKGNIESIFWSLLLYYSYILFI